MTRIGKKQIILAVILSLVLIAGIVAPVGATSGLSYEYTLDADFDEGDLNNVVYDPSDQLQLSSETEPFNFIWVAVSSRGTAVKIDTQTGQVLGEYWTSPYGNAGNPSRTTVDKNGNVWVANRNRSSVIHIASIPTDRNNNGVITTSTGLGNILPWGQDEAILHYVPVPASGTRHVSVDANNDVWVSGTGNRVFVLIDGDTGNIIRSEPSVGYGGYGGLIDGNGVIWSANRLLRWDTANPLTGPSWPTPPANWRGYGHDSYGLGIDSQGNVWNTALSGPDNAGTANDGIIRKFAPDGSLIGTYHHGDPNAQGCVADKNGDVWVAHCLWHSNTVGHILNDGTYVGNVVLDPANVGVTGVAVDADGYIWATGHNNGIVYKIDPNAGPIGGGGVNVGAVVQRIVIGGSLYNYSDMTGSTLTGAPDSGTWTITHDSTVNLAEWGTVSWTADTPGDSSITVTAASSNDNINFGLPEVVTNGLDLTVDDGQYLKVSVSFSRSTNGDSPILYDLTIAAKTNEPPDTSGAEADPGCLWPPNHKFVDISITGVTDPDGDPVTITITGVTSDEPTASDKGSGGAKHAPDAMIDNQGNVSVRAERSGDGDGRVYVISFTASDGQGGESEGSVEVKVPHDQSSKKSDVCPAIDSGQNYDATQKN